MSNPETRAVDPDSLVIVNDGAVGFSAEDLSVLLLRQPLEKLPALNPRVVRVPGPDKLVLRYKPTRSFVKDPADQNPTALEAHFNSYERQLARLKALGLGVVKHTIFATTHSAEDKSMTYVVSENIEDGRDLARHGCLLPIAQYHDLGTRIASSLFSYYSSTPDATCEKGQSDDLQKMIWDIDLARQWSLPNGELYDYDPYVVAASPYERYNALGSVAWWVDMLPASTEQRTLYNDLCEQEKFWQAIHRTQQKQSQPS